MRSALTQGTRLPIVLVLLAATLACGGWRLTVTSPVAAAERPVLFYGDRATREPRSIDAGKIRTGTGGPPFDETIYRARALRWSGWGSPIAIGRGLITYCVIGYTRCATKRGSVTVSTIRLNGCGDEIPRRMYRYVRWNFPGHRSPRVEAALIC